MQLNHLIEPQIKLLQMIQRLIERHHIGHVHPGRGRCISGRHRHERHAAATLFSVALAHVIDHHRAQHFADVGEKLQPRLPLQTLALGHAHEAFMHQRRRVQSGHATGLGQTAAREALNVGIQRRKQRAHRVGITGGGALNE